MTEIKLGDVTVTRVEESHGPIMPAEAFFPSIPADAWTAHHDLLVPDHLAGGFVTTAQQTWLLRSGGRTILIDTAIGNDKVRPAVDAWSGQHIDFLGRLSAAGVEPQDVDVVINTHLHLDHVGWNTRLAGGEWVPTFENATYLMSAADFHHWNPAHNPAVAGGVNENVWEDSIRPVHAAGQVQLWEDSHQIDEALRLEAAPGHTPGHGVVELASGTDRALFAGDIVHSPLQLVEHGHNSCFCEDPATAVATRRRLLAWAADSGALVLPAHFSGHSALEITSRGAGFAVTEWAAFPPYDTLS